MKLAFPLALGLALSAAAAPAFAQLTSSGMGGGMGGPGGAPTAQPKADAPNLAPSGLPGIGSQAPATGPKMQQPIGGDPTQELFAAINKNDYNSAQDAISRGADMTAKDQFGETPLDLSIALNRNNITFMLLGTRNELAAQGGGGNMGAPWTLNTAPSSASSKSKHGKHQSTPVQAAGVSVQPTPHVIVPAGDTGTPNPQAGFLGFGPKS